MDYKTVYDLATEPIVYFNDVLTAAYVFFIAGVVLIILVLKKDIMLFNKTTNLILGITFLFVSTIFIVAFLGGQYLAQRNAKEKMQDNLCKAVEGYPQSYRPMPAEGHNLEHFTIDGIYFEYSDYNLEIEGYNHAASLGGVISPGNYYRLTYYEDDAGENKILKIEIAQD